MENKAYTIDAKGKSLGRVASQAAKILMGKNLPTFVRHKDAGNKVQILNASKLKVSPKKMKNKIYVRYSGYPGGLTEEVFEKLVARKGYAEVFRLAVYGMLPGNRLRKGRMMNLEVSE